MWWTSSSLGTASGVRASSTRWMFSGCSVSGGGRNSRKRVVATLWYRMRRYLVSPNSWRAPCWATSAAFSDRRISKPKARAR